MVESHPLLTVEDGWFSPKLDAVDVAEVERRSDVNLVHLFAWEFRRIRSGAEPYGS